jgi:hypothetical protein
VVLDAEAKTSLERTIDRNNFVAECFRDTHADRRRLRAALVRVDSPALPTVLRS